MNEVMLHSGILMRVMKPIGMLEIREIVTCTHTDIHMHAQAICNGHGWQEHFDLFCLFVFVCLRSLL